MLSFRPPPALLLLFGVLGMAVLGDIRPGCRRPPALGFGVALVPRLEEMDSDRLHDHDDDDGYDDDASYTKCD